MSKVDNNIVLITKEADEVWDSVAPLIENGFELLFFPTFKTKALKPALPEPIKLFDFDFIVFSSGNSVKYFMEYLEDNKILPDFSEIRVIVTGPKTKQKCELFGLNAELPMKFSAEGIIEFLSKEDLNGKKVLFPCSKIARKELEEGLKNMGADLLRLDIYETVKSVPSIKILDKLHSQMPGYFIFTSPSAFNNFLEIENISVPEEYFSGKHVYAIGKTTANEIKEKGIEEVKHPQTFTLESVVNMLVDENQIDLKI